MEKKRVAMILYTQGLEYDDRIKKEIISIARNCPEITFEIFAITPNNQPRNGITDYGVNYHIPFLRSRDKYKSGSHTLVKAYDFYKTILPLLKGFDVIWCADIETFLFPALLPKGNPIIWDLHELPGAFMNNRLMRRVFTRLTERCALIYHANQSRIDYLNQLGMLSKKIPQIPLRNYPNANLPEAETPPFNKLDEFKKWRGNRNCIYLQGATSMIRRPVESASAIIESNDYCGVVVGGFPDKAMSLVEGKYSKALISRKLFFAGKIPQVQTKNFIAECKLGLVFYETCSMNNIYCEPNRMFQTIMMGRPVIVGNNPPMKELIDKTQAGISLKSDGSDIVEIVNAISTIDRNYDFYRSNANSAIDEITWEGQEQLLISTFKEAINL